MDSKIVLGKILQRLFDKAISEADGYNSFGFLRETNDSVYVNRENDLDTQMPFEKLLLGLRLSQPN